MLDVTWALAAQVGLWGWIGSMVGFIMRAFPAEGVFDRRAASIWGGERSAPLRVMGSRDDDGMRRSRCASVILLLLVLSSLLPIMGCGGPSALSVASLRDPSVDMTWPPAPHPARIRFLREISGPEQIKLSREHLPAFWSLSPVSSSSPSPL